jgi:hypothetical protein
MIHFCSAKESQIASAITEGTRTWRRLGIIIRAESAVLA